MTLLEELRRIARPAAIHEAGHYVIARALGFRADIIFVNASMFGADGGSHIYLHSQLPTLDAVSDYLERRIQVLCAGVPAEYLRDGFVDEDAAPNALKNGSAVNDWAKVRENVRTLCGMRFLDLPNPAQQLEELALSLLNNAEELVLIEAPQIKAVAERLIAEISQPGHTELTTAALNQVPEIKERFKTG